MTKMHFEAAAAIVRGMIDAGFSDIDRALVARRYAQLFRTFNPRFDDQRFYTACGFAAGAV